MHNKKLAKFIQEHGLSQDYMSAVETCFLPITEAVYKRHMSEKKPIVIGINGAQGSGKSTLANLIVFLLRDEFKLNGVAISIDDFYRTKAERKQLSDSIHPLLITRGVPGTHDVSLAIQTIDSLINYKGSITIPRFNKAIDDRFPEQYWDVVGEPIDIVVFEGWCLGAQAQSDDQLSCPVNELEAHEDENGAWRSYVNKQLQGDYAGLFSYIDKWIMLKAPSFDCVLNWRLEQEVKLRNSLDADDNEASSNCMSETELARFIQFYQRITENLNRTLPGKVDYLIELNRDRTIKNLLYLSTRGV
jgi:D-glycerate 3-kinase